MNTVANEPKLSEYWTRKLTNVALGLQKTGGFQPVSVSLTPLELSTSSWKMANITARALGKLFYNMAIKESWLTKTIMELPDLALAKRLLKALPNQSARNATLISISRHDFMLDRNRNWKLVESNSIASGMGPFSDSLRNILKTENQALNLAPNNSALYQAQAMIDSAKKVNGHANPTFIFVVEPQEDNIFDHQMMINALEQLGAKVYSKTLFELHQQADVSSQHLLINEIDVVDGLYFRTGYNLQDYGNSAEQEALIKFRGLLETKKVAMAPSILHQISTNKWVQLKLSKMNIDQLMAEFELTLQDAIFAQLALSTPQKAATDVEDLEVFLNTQDWILKQQGEGGGHIIHRQNLAELAVEEGAVLMQCIKPKERAKAVIQLFNGEFHDVRQAVSELGIFTVGDDQDYGGYLLRTKPKQTIEAGVHKGFGMIDTVVLLD